MNCCYIQLLSWALNSRLLINVAGSTVPLSFTCSCSGNQRRFLGNQWHSFSWHYKNAIAVCRDIKQVTHRNWQGKAERCHCCGHRSILTQPIWQILQFTLIMHPITWPQEPGLNSGSQRFPPKELLRYSISPFQGLSFNNFTPNTHIP